MTGFVNLQSQLTAALVANTPGSGVDHVLLALPSFSVGESLLSHYAGRIPSLEHRYLVASLMLRRIDSCELVFITSEAPEQPVLDYYRSFVCVGGSHDTSWRLRVIEVPDRSARAVAAKLLDRPDLLEQLRTIIDGRPVLIEPWNVTEAEVAVALELGAPINGTDPELWPLGYKGAGRQIFAEAGVPIPLGHENVRTVEDVLAAIEAIRAARPGVPGVVVKHDNSGAGDGNVVLELGDETAGLDQAPTVRDRIEALPDWYLADLHTGGVVEELISGADFSSPSVQIDITPRGDVTVLATHEQVLDGQVYTGCRFPADPAYAAELARHGAAIGKALASRGVVGRLSVDFAASRDDAGRWHVFALEVNLRKGGTTHPYAVLRNLVAGRYDPPSGTWIAQDGSNRSYFATDNLVHPSWTGVAPTAVMAEVREAGLDFDQGTGTGVVLHMFSGLAIDGRLGVTAIGWDADHAAELFETTRLAVDRASRDRG